MTVTTGVARVAANTALGTQDITVADFGTPKAAIFIMTYAITDGVAADHNGFSYGATDGTNQFFVHANAQNGVAPSETRQEIFPSNCIGLNNPGTNSTNGFAIFDSWITNGVRIDWTDAPSAAYLLTVVLFGGTDLQVFVGSQLLTDTINTVHTVNNVGFESHLLFTACCPTRRSASPAAGDFNISLGAVHNDTSGSIAQRCYTCKDDDNRDPSQCVSFITNIFGLAENVSAANVTWGAEFSDFTALGFDITERIGGANDTEVFYLCLSGADPADFAVGTHSTPTANGNDSEVGPNFEPQLVMLGMTHITSINSGSATTDAGIQGIGAFTDSAEFANSGVSEDASSPDNTQSLSENVAVQIPDSDGTAGITASFVSFDTLGYTLNYTAAKGTARQFWFAAIKTSAVVTRPIVTIEGATSTIHEQNAKLLHPNDAIPAWRWISTYLLNSSASNSLAVNGSGGAPQSFFYTPPANYDFVANRMIILLITSGAMTALTNFADLGAALATGIEIKADGVLISTWQSNIDMFLDYYDFDPLDDVSDIAADTSLLGRWKFVEDTNRQGILIPNGQTFEIVINDDLSSLLQFRVKIKGKLKQRIY